MKQFSFRFSTKKFMKYNGAYWLATTAFIMSLTLAISLGFFSTEVAIVHTVASLAVMGLLFLYTLIRRLDVILTLSTSNNNSPVLSYYSGDEYYADIRNKTERYEIETFYGYRKHKNLLTIYGDIRYKVVDGGKERIERVEEVSIYNYFTDMEEIIFILEQNVPQKS